MNGGSAKWRVGVVLALGGLVAAGAAIGDDGPLDQGVLEAIAEALQDEYQGEAIYAGVLQDHGEIRPFSRVVHAEQRHAGLLEALLVGRGLPVPKNRWTDAAVPSYASVKDACVAAVEFEVRNVALYDRLLAGRTVPEDVRSVFEHNRMASLEHHKPAFERCSGRAGAPGSSVASAGGGGRSRGSHGHGHHGCGHHGCGHQGCGSGGCQGIADQR